MLHNIIYGYIARIADTHWKLISSERLLEERRQFFAQHRQILEAIRAQNVEAAVQAMQRHMTALTQNMDANRELLRDTVRFEQKKAAKQAEDELNDAVQKQKNQA